MGTRRKTVLRTIRLTQETDDILKESAKAKNISVNALVATILTKYVEWDRYVERFNFISVASGTFESILREVDDKKLEEIAAELGSKMPRSVAMFWFRKVNLDTFLKTISLYDKYSGLQRHEVETNGKDYIITFHHNLGKKWSIFLKHFMGQAVNSILGLSPKTDMSENTITISFHLP